MGRESGAGQVTIESAPGLLDSARQSLEVLQREFGGNPQGQGLLAPLLHHHDLGHLAGSVSDVHGGHGSMLGSPQCPVPPQGRPVSYAPGADMGPQPRVLDPYSMATPPPVSGANVNPFWSSQPRSYPVEGRPEHEVALPGDVRRSPSYLKKWRPFGRKFSRRQRTSLQRRSSGSREVVSHRPLNLFQVRAVSRGGRRVVRLDLGRE